MELGSRVASKGTRPQTLPTLPQASKATTLKATATTSRLPFARPQTPQTLPTLPQASKATTLTATTCPCHLGLKTAVCPASNPPNASNPPAGLQGNNSYSYYLPLPSVFQGAQDCRLPALKPPKPSRRPPRQQLLQLHAPAICFSGGSRQVCLASNPPNASAGFQGNNSYSYTVATTCPCHLFFRGFKTAVCPASNPPNASNPPAGLQGNNAYLTATILYGSAICFSGGSRLPFARPQTPQTLPQASQATTLTATCPCHRFYFSRGSRLPFAWLQTLQTLPQASKATTLTATYMPLPSVFQGVQARPHILQTLPQASKATTLTATCPCHLFFRGFTTSLPGLKPSKRFRRLPRQQLLQLHCSYYMPLPSVFQGVQDCRLPGLKPPKRFQPSRRPPRQQLLQLQLLLQDCRLPGLKPPKRFQPSRRPRVASKGTRPQTIPTLPQASKATTLTATATTSRLPFARPQTPQRFQPSRRPPRQQLLQLLHAPAIWRSRLPFARPQTPQTLPTLPQASKATTLTATTCPCHLFFRGFKTAVCPPSNPPNPPAGLQGNNSYSSSNPPAGLQGNNSYSYSYYFKTAVCSASNLPNASNPPAGLQGNNSYSYYMPLPSGVQDCRLPGLKPPKRFQPSRRPPRQQLLQLLHAPAICFSGGSRLPFARPQTPQTLPQASKATTLTATCPCHLFFRGFTTSLPGLKPSKRFRRLPRQQLLQLHCSYYMPLPSVFQGVQDCRLPGLKPPKRFQPSRRPPRQQRLSYSYYTTCPCHLFFRGFKTAVCPPSNPPNPPAGLPGNNSYSYMPLPSILFFKGLKTAVCLASNPPNASAGFQGNNSYSYIHAPAICFSGGSSPPSHPPNAPAGLQGNNSYSYMPLPSVFQGVHDKLPGLKPSKRFRRLPRQQLLQLHCSYYMPLPSVFQGVQDCRLPGLKPPKRFQPFRRPPRQQLLQLQLLLQDCRLPGLKPPKRFQPSRRPRVASKGTRPQTLSTLLQASKATTLTATATTSRLPFARPQTPQTLPTLPQASKATTLTATTCPCHLGFKTAVCPASNPPNASNPPAGLQGNNSYSYYMPLPSVFQGVQDCRLPALKPPKPSRRPPRQQLLQLHAPAICFSGGSRQVCLASNPPNASAGFQGNNSYSYTVATTCPCHLFFRGFKTAVCPASNPPNASNPPAGLQGNNSYLTATILHAPAICFSGGSRLPFARPQTPQTLPQASQATTLTATCPCHRFYPPTPAFAKAGAAPGTTGGVELGSPQTLQTLPQASKATTLTATCPCHLFSGGSRLPFARPQTPQTLPQASKATTLTATCPCHLFFRGFKTAVCPASNPPNPSAGLQLLQLHAPAICFSGGSRLPFARPQTPQTLPQAFFRGFKTAVCPGSNAPNPSAGLQGNNSYSYRPLPSVFRGFKTAVCPASNPPNPSAGLQGNNSYSYMPLPSVFQGVQGCRLPGLKPPKPFRRPPRQQLLHLPSVFQGVQDCRLPGLKQLHAPAICFSGGSRLSSARPQTLQTLPQASKATTLTATCPCHLFFRGFKTAVCPASNPPNPSAGLQGNNSYSYMPLPSVFQGVQDCRLPGLKPPKPFRRPPRQQLLQLHAPAICFSGGSRLPFARPQTPQTLPQTFFRGFKTAVCPASNPPNPSAGLQGNNSYSYMPLPSVFQGVQDCRLPGLKRSKPFRRPPRQQLLQLHAPAICFSGGSRLPFARPQTLQTLPQASKATTLTATCPCHLFFRGFKTAVCPASNPPNPPAGLFQGVQDCRLPGLKRSKPFRGLQGNNSYSYMPLPSVFQGVQDCRLPGLKPSKPFRRPPRQQLLQLHAPAICFSGGSRLPFARPQTPQTFPQASKATTLTATCPCHLFFRGFKTAVCPASNPPNPSAGLQGNNSYTCHLFFRGFKTAVCLASNSYMPLPSVFLGGSRLSSARPQTLQTLPQASKATTLTATCPCHLFFRGFKTAVCPASNPPNPSAGLQGNNSYSYMPLPSVFQGVQDCRLPGLKPPKPFRRPPRQQLLQLHAPAICFSGGSRLPFARPQTLQTLPQASKATATCPCHLFLLFCFFCERKKGG